MKLKIQPLVAAVLAAVAGSLTTFAEEATAPKPKPERATGASKGLYPFRGTVSSIDAQAHTIGLARQEGGDRILKIGAESTFARDGKDITAAEIRKGDYLRGRVERHANGEEVIVKATAEEKPDKSGDDKPKRQKKSASN